jgi:hypothetical protein
MNSCLRWSEGEANDNHGWALPRSSRRGQAAGVVTQSNPIEILADVCFRVTPLTDNELLRPTPKASLVPKSARASGEAVARHRVCRRKDRLFGSITDLSPRRR